MSYYPPIVVAHPLDSDIRLVQIGPGYDPAKEPLLAHAGLACELHGRIWVEMGGLTGVSDKTRQFLTTVSNNMSEELLMILAEELGDPVKRASTGISTRLRADQIRTDLEEMPVIPEGLFDAPTFGEPEATEPDDTPEP
jgi:hypothetical protein